MVHEISHILQGVNRHSAQGVMKSHWDDRDLREMLWKPLEFTGEDVLLINQGLDARTSKALLAANDRPGVATR